MGYKKNRLIQVIVGIFCCLQLTEGIGQNRNWWIQTQFHIQYREAGRNGFTQSQATYGNYSPRNLNGGLNLALGRKLASFLSLGVQFDQQHTYVRQQADAKFWVHQLRVGPVLRIQPALGRFYFPIQGSLGWERYIERFYERREQAFKRFKQGNIFYAQAGTGIGMLIDGKWSAELMATFTYDQGDLTLNLPGNPQEEYFDYTLRLRLGIIYHFKGPR